MKVYLLWHNPGYWEEQYELRLIGVFSSEKAAYKAAMREAWKSSESLLLPDDQERRYRLFERRLTNDYLIEPWSVRDE